MTDQLHALEAAIEMSLRRCQKLKCNSPRCACSQNAVCTEMRGCTDCENELKHYIIEQ